MTESLQAIDIAYGYPGPEGPRFWGFMGLIFGAIFLAIVTEPLWNLAS